MRRTGSWGTLGGLVFLGLVAGCKEEPEPPAEQPAPEQVSTTAAADSVAVTLADASGVSVGRARIGADSAGAVVIEVDVTGSLATGSHGIHVHTTGSCAARNDTAFAAAGAHFNPEAKKHGLENPEGPHAGDMTNLDVGADGRGTARFVLPHASLASGPNALRDADGAALVIHAQPDDQKTDPSGNSGSRVACGVIPE